MFVQKVDKRSRKAMTKFILNHFRYNTMNDWNKSTSYANNVKIYNLKLSSEEEDKAWEIIDTEEFYDQLRWSVIEPFAIKYNYNYQIGFNGRSSGYLVLYKGGQKDSGYKARCTACGQLIYKSTEELGHCKCGRCGQEKLMNLTKPIKQIYTMPGQSIGEYDEYELEEMSLVELKREVEFITDFDKACDLALDFLKDLIKNAEVVEEEYQVTKTKKVLEW